MQLHVYPPIARSCLDSHQLSNNIISPSKDNRLSTTSIPATMCRSCAGAGAKTIQHPSLPHLSHLSLCIHPPPLYIHLYTHLPTHPSLTYVPSHIPARSQSSHLPISHPHIKTKTFFLQFHISPWFNTVHSFCISLFTSNDFITNVVPSNRQGK